MIGDRVLQIGGDESFDDHGARCVLLVQHAFVEQRLDSIPRQKRTDLVSGQQFHLAILGSNCHSHAIAVRISSSDQVGVLFFSKIDRHG